MKLHVCLLWLAYFTGHSINILKVCTCGSMCQNFPHFHGWVKSHCKCTDCVYWFTYQWALSLPYLLTTENDATMTWVCKYLLESCLPYFGVTPRSRITESYGNPTFNFLRDLHAGRRWWHPTPLLLPGKPHGRRSLVGCSPWGHTELDTTEQLHFHFSLSCIGEGNGNPLQCSCLENPRDGGAWWAAVYGVAQSRTRLKRLSSSSSSNVNDITAGIVNCRLFHWHCKLKYWLSKLMIRMFSWWKLT